MIYTVLVVSIIIGQRAPQQSPQEPNLSERAARVADASQWIWPFYYWADDHTLLTFRGGHIGPSASVLVRQTVRSFVNLDIRNDKSRHLSALEQLVRRQSDFPWMRNSGMSITASYLSPDGRYLAWVLGLTSGPPLKWSIVSLDGEYSYATSWFVYSGVWTPDSRQFVGLAYDLGSRFDNGVKVMKIDVASKQETEAELDQGFRSALFKSGYIDILGVLANNRIIALSRPPFESSQHYVDIVEFGLKPDPMPPTINKVDIPTNLRLTGAQLSPDGKRLVWNFERFTPHQEMSNSPVAANSDKLFSEIWISDANGNNLRPLGYLGFGKYQNSKANKYFDSQAIFDVSLRWTPGSDQLSYIYGGKLYLIPAKPD